VNSTTSLQALLLGVLLTACQVSVAGRGVPSSYGYGYDSPSAACRQNPAYCAKVAGEEAILPGTQSLHTLTTAGATVAVAVKVLDKTLHLSIRRALEQCVDQARTYVLLKHLDGRRPPQECNEDVEREGRTLTRAMWLGNLMHDAAFECVKEQLEQLRPGGFSLKPRYRYDKRTDKTTLLPRDEVQRLISQGRTSELRGTLEPDAVLHAGDPLHAEAVYDFKFPCVELDSSPRWREYPEGHPHHKKTQKQMYERALKAPVWHITPRMGSGR